MHVIKKQIFFKNNYYLLLNSFFKLKQFNDLDYPAKPRWALDENAAFLKGSGVRL